MLLDALCPLNLMAVYMYILSWRVCSFSKGSVTHKLFNLVSGYPDWTHMDVYFQKIQFPPLKVASIHPEEVLTSSL